jgi:hypothetical protein
VSRAITVLHQTLSALFYPYLQQNKNKLNQAKKCLTLKILIQQVAFPCFRAKQTLVPFYLEPEEILVLKISLNYIIKIKEDLRKNKI